MCVIIGWEYGTVACKAVPYVQGVSVCASINSITAIAFDRSVRWCCCWLKDKLFDFYLGSLVD